MPPKPKRLFRDHRPVPSIGNESPNPASPDFYDGRFIAFHEAGHAVAAVVLGIGLQSVDIEESELPGSGFSLGKTNLGMRDVAAEILGKGEDVVKPFLVQMLAGAVAESIVNSAVTTGEYQTHKKDVEQAWKFAMMAICEYTDTGDGHARFSEAEQRRCLPRMEALMGSAREDTYQVIRENREAITAVAELLLERTRLEGAEVAAIVAVHREA